MLSKPIHKILLLIGWQMLLLPRFSTFGQNVPVGKAPRESKQTPGSPVIPRPVSYERLKGHFFINKATSILLPAGLAESALAVLAGPLRELTGLPLPIIDAAGPGNRVGSNYLQFSIDSSGGLKPEGYSLVVDPSNVRITGRDEAGLFYGIQTLVQLLGKPWHAEGYPVEACSITDYPRFHYRGMHLDVGRHFFPVPVIEKWINALALFKINTFHWHLTDDQGWRIEIKRYPRLQSVSAWRDETLIGHKKETPHRFDGKKYGGYYTQEEVRSIVRFAAARHITVIPEIEMPGHAQAVLAAYPELGCTGGPYKTAAYWGVFDDVFCAGNDSVFVFLENVLDEVMDLFPSKYIHIGGDECPKTKWQACPKCQRRIRELGLADEHALQSYFIQRIGKYINANGRSIIGWDEILEGGLTPGATVMSWQGEEGGLAAARQKHTAILSPESNLYFDYYQSLYPEEPLAAGGYTPLRKVYGYEPLAGIQDPEILQYVAGVQGQLWTEYLSTPARAEYMMFPRAAAMAEVGWRQTRDDGDTAAVRKSDPGYPGYPDFLRRFRLQEGLLKRLNIRYADNFEEIDFNSEALGGKDDGVSVETPGEAPGRTSVAAKIRVRLFSSLPGAVIRYTIGNTSSGNESPGPGSAAYTKPLALEKSCTIRARLYDKGLPVGRVFEKNFLLHKGVGASVSLAHQPIGRYNPGPAMLVNGLTGSDRYNDGQWLGFSGTDAEAVIDLGKIRSIRSVGTDVLNYHWQKMWAPVSLRFYISTDGIRYQEIFRQTEFAVNGINRVRSRFPAIAARYLKVTGVNRGIIPDGEYGAGGKALLMMDEIIIE